MRLVEVIDPRHLEAAQTGSLRIELHAHRASVVHLETFFREEVAADLARFLVEDARYEEEFRLFSSADPVDERTWTAAEDQDRLSRVRRLASSAPGSELDSGTLAYLQVRRTLASPDLRSFAEAVSGRRLGDARDVGTRRMDPGDFVRPHRFDARTCMLWFEVFLSQHWEARLGGELSIIDQHERITRIAPTFNRAVLADVSGGATLLVAPIRPQLRGPRLSLTTSFPGA